MGKMVAKKNGQNLAKLSQITDFFFKWKRRIFQKLHCMLCAQRILVGIAVRD